MDVHAAAFDLHEPYGLENPHLSRLRPEVTCVNDQHPLGLFDLSYVSQQPRPRVNALDARQPLPHNLCNYSRPNSVIASKSVADANYEHPCPVTHDRSKPRYAR